MDNLTIYKNKRISFISNPQLIQVNEVIIGVTNYELIQEILNQSFKISNMLPNIDLTLDSILKQRSLMPILSHKVKDEEDDKSTSTINVDYRKMKHFYFATIPDLILAPFKNVPLFKKSSNSIFVNPSSVIANTINQGDILGSFVRIYVFAPDKNLGTSILNRLRIDRVNIEEKI